MAEKQVYKITIHFTNGKQKSYAFRQQDEDSNVTRNIEKFQEADQLLIMLKDRMVWIPFNNIERLELFPAPKAWPRTTIHNAIEVE
ncbi:MAG: hypothetical protein ACWGOW_05410 [Gammaproteobacteria bacterium]